MDTVRRHPLMRALRVDKMTYAALEATLDEYVCDRARQTIPVLRAMTVPVEELDLRARRLALAASEAGWRGEVLDGESAIGGGSAPGTRLSTRLVALRHATRSADAVLARLRARATPIIARIDDDRVLLDLRTVEPGDDEELMRALSELSSTNEREPR